MKVYKVDFNSRPIYIRLYQDQAEEWPNIGDRITLYEIEEDDSTSMILGKGEVKEITEIHRTTTLRPYSLATVEVDEASIRV